MRSKSSVWFETKIRYEKIMEDGLSKKVTEPFVVDALSWTEAEANIMNAMQQYISGEFEITDIKKAKYGEIFFDDTDAAADRWYLCKLSFISINETTLKEKRSNVVYLVQAQSLEKARRNIDEVMSHTMIDFEIKKVEETQILDVFEHDALKNAVKNFVDSIPEGQKVTISATNEQGEIFSEALIDKSGEADKE